MSAAINRDVRTQTLYGWEGGCLHSIKTNNGSAILSIYAGTEAGEGDERLLIQRERANKVVQAIQSILSSDGTAVKGISVLDDGAVVQVNFGSGSGGIKRCSAFAETRLSELAPLCKAQTCACCGKPFQGDALPVLTGSYVVPMHAACVDSLTADALSPDPALEEKHYRPFGGFIGAILGMLLGALLWTLIGMAGYIASIVGLVMALAISKGYDLLGGKPGKTKLVLMIVLVIVGVLLGTCGVYGWQAHQYYQEEASSLRPWETLTISEGNFILRVLKDAFTTPDGLTNLLKDVGLGMVFALLGCFSTIRRAGQLPGQSEKPHVLKGQL